MFNLQHPDTEKGRELADYWFVDADLVPGFTPADILSEIADSAIRCFEGCKDFQILPEKSSAVDTAAAYIKELLRGHPGLTGNFSTVMDYVSGEIAEALVVEVD